MNYKLASKLIMTVTKEEILREIVDLEQIILFRFGDQDV